MSQKMVEVEDKAGDSHTSDSTTVTTQSLEKRSPAVPTPFNADDRSVTPALNATTVDQRMDFSSGFLKKTRVHIRTTNIERRTELSYCGLCVPQRQ
eukprot:m.1218362 g.1218362  ORF g.1218362 m.1218362 type:complete len:96 (-) comp24619_c0_seq12:3322-3609(-)